jgi:hypothetical protein
MAKTMAYAGIPDKDKQGSEGFMSWSLPLTVILKAGREAGHEGNGGL